MHKRLNHLHVAGLSPPVATDLSVVIPVFNGAETIAGVVRNVCSVLADVEFEIILVNDGSRDDSERVCRQLAESWPQRIVFLQLARNFGEHNAVMAGIRHSCGEYVAIIDDDGQNGAADVLRMYQHARQHHLDVVYARYANRAHPRLRIFGSLFNDRTANLLLDKPRELYLSSFKLISRQVVEEISKYSGPHPYIDGLILRATSNIGQLDVTHHPRRAGRSGYTLSKLVGLWMRMSVGFSLAPLRVATLAGMLVACGALIWLAVEAMVKLWLQPDAAIAIPCMLAAMSVVAGIQLIALGIIGEYVGRIFQHQSGAPQFVVRYIQQGDAGASRSAVPRGRNSGSEISLG